MTYELIPDAQVFPKSVAALVIAGLNLPLNSVLLSVFESSSKSSTAHTLGLPFMERFYNVFDARNSGGLQIGFAPNQYYKEVYNWVSDSGSGSGAGS